MEKIQQNPPGLTTTKAPFIEQARQNGEMFIKQPYEQYNSENHECWRKLYKSMVPLWKKFANDKFMEGIENLAISPDSIPRLEDINRFLEPLTGFEAKAVSGYVPSYNFFDCLKNRQFPTTITIRDINKINYLPEPDIFHDVAGHVPMHTDKTFADVLVKFGALASSVADRHGSIKNQQEKLAKIKSNLVALSRFFWFTIEFGLMKQHGRLCVYGSGILSSVGEIEHSIVSPNVQRYPFQLEWVVNQYFEIDSFQPLLFVIDSFEHLYDQVNQLEKFLHAGKLDNVAFGEPEINEQDLAYFLSSTNTFKDNHE